MISKSTWSLFAVFQNSVSRPQRVHATHRSSSFQWFTPIRKRHNYFVVQSWLLHHFLFSKSLPSDLHTTPSIENRCVLSWTPSPTHWMAESKLANADFVDLVIESVVAPGSNQISTHKEKSQQYIIYTREIYPGGGMKLVVKVNVIL